jgi:hypothetical protein
MDEILGPIGETIGGIFGSPVVQLGFRLIGIYLIVIWLATAYWAFRDMQQRSDNVILPYLAAAGIILFTPIFFILAVWVYKIIRPHEKIGGSGSATWRKRPCWPRSTRSTTVRAANGASTMSGSSAPAAAPG